MSNKIKNNDTRPQHSLVAEDPEVRALYSQCVDELMFEPARITSFDSDGILGLIHTGYSIGHAITGRFLYTSKPYAMALGYTPQEMEWNMRWFDIVEIGEGERDARSEITRQLESIRNFGGSTTASRRTWRHKLGHTVTGECRYYGAHTSDIRCAQTGDADAIAQGFPVIICEARFDHFNSSSAQTKLKEDWV